MFLWKPLLITKLNKLAIQRVNAGPKCKFSQWVIHVDLYVHYTALLEATTSNYIVGNPHA